MPRAAAIPFYSQFETPEIAAEGFARGFPAALAADPRWRDSGARTLDEYRHWAWHLCGMACLKMILATRTGSVHPILTLARACTAYGGYRVESGTGSILGLYYAPFVHFVTEQFGLRARIVERITTAELPGLLREGEFFIASVHSAIRIPYCHPPRKGGHLVLVFESALDQVRFHNPGAHERTASANVLLPSPDFERFFAGRGILVLSESATGAPVQKL